MKTLALAVSLLYLTGCSFTGPSSIDTTNQMIVQMNENRLVNYSDAMANCGDNAACQVGVSMAFAGNLGQQQLFRPETPLDYLRELRWIAPMAMSLWSGSGDGDRGSNWVKGDGNIIMVGNESKASGYASLSQPIGTSYQRNYDQSNKNFTGVQPISDEGLGDL